MTGKAPPSRSRKDKPRSSRPYDRPDQSLLGKVASRVKQYSSWLFNVSSWVRTNSQEATSDEPLDTLEADLTENEDEPETSQAPVSSRLSSRSKRPRLEMGENSTSISEVPPHWLGPLNTTQSENFTSKIQKSSVTSIVPECETSRKEASIIVNDDHSENSDGSASTSGCSSLVSSQDKPHRYSGLKLNESAVAMLQQEFKWNPQPKPRREVATITTETLSSSHNLSRNSSLWSPSLPASAAKSPQIPSLLNNSRPSFSVSSFTGSSKGMSTGNKMTSPFYEGTTTFGGASAYRRKPMLNTPYQYNSPKPAQCQVRVKENPSSTEVECMSTAAKRILHTLENMSTPITDAKKIPNVARSSLNFSSSVTLPSQRLRSYLSTSMPSTSTPQRGPPVVNLNTISKLSVLKNHNAKMKNSMMELPLKEQSISSLSEENSFNQSQDKSTLPIPITSKMGTGGGKMKTKLREPMHVTSKPRIEEDVPEYELPSVPLPISMTMPVFKFSTDNIPERTNASTKEQPVEEQTRSPTITPPFTFSSPIQHINPTNNIQTEMSMENHFKFSNPVGEMLKSKPHPSEELPNRREMTLANRTMDDILKSVLESKGEKKAKPSKKTEKESIFKEQEENSVQVSSPLTNFSSTTTPFSSSISTGFGDQFMPKPGTWRCTTCYIVNDPSKQACIACESPKASTQSTSKIPEITVSNSFQPTGKWECGDCWVRNQPSDTNCVSCGGLKPGTASPANQPEATNKVDSSKELPSNSFVLKQSSSDTWECDVCLSKNASSSSRCSSCSTLKPVKKKSLGSFNSTFKFGSVAAATTTSEAFTSKSGFIFTSTPATTTAPFKFGVTDETKSVAVTSNNSTSVNASVAVFGGAPIPFGEKSQEKKEADKPSPFILGSAAATSTSSDVAPKENVSSGTAAPTISSVPSFKSGSFNFQPKVPSLPKIAEVDAEATLPNSVKKSDVSSGKSEKPKEKPSESFGSTFKFGATPVVTTANSSETFKFGSNATTTVPTLSTFKFGVAPGGNKSPASIAFGNSAAPVTFGSMPVKLAADSTEEKKDKPVTNPLFVFGGAAASSATNEVPKFNKPVTTTASSISGALLPSTLETTQAPSSFTSFQTPASTHSSSSTEFGSVQFGKPLVSASSDAPKSGPTLAFGAPTTTTMPQVFSFGSSTFPSGTSAFTANFGAKPTEVTTNNNETVKKSPGLFAFGASAKPETKPGGFGFSNLKDEKVNFMSQVQPSAPSSFGMLSKPEPAGNDMNAGVSSNVFKFGSSAPAPPAPSSNAFVFGGTSKAETSTVSAGQFTFGSAPKTMGFGGFQGQQTAVTSSVPTFNFGSSGSTNFSPAGSSFSLVNKGNQPASLNAQPAATAPAFSSQISQPMFGSSASAAVPTFGTSSPAAPAFGSTPAPTLPAFQTPKQEPTGGFNFNPQPSSSNLFTFNAQPPMKKSPSNPSQGGFNFNMSNQAEVNTSFQSPSFNLTAPPSFNFGATSTPTNQPFQFAATETSSNTGTSSSTTRKIRKAIRRRRAE